MDLPMSPAGSLWGAECLAELHPLLEGSQLRPDPGHPLSGLQGSSCPGLSLSAAPLLACGLLPVQKSLSQLGLQGLPSLLKALGH